MQGQQGENVVKFAPLFTSTCSELIVHVIRATVNSLLQGTTEYKSGLVVG